MEAWVHVFSKFTPEALLFEALGICVLGAAYAAFWVLRKRRFGSAGADVPSPVVRAYLNELIGDAQVIRQQLFGLIKAGEIPTSGSGPSLMASMGGSSGAGMDAGTAEKVAALEARMAEQIRAYESLTGEKQKIEQELAAARIAGEKAAGDGAATVSGDNALIDELKNKIATLEGKLAEYSVIEDDLANLKRLQQENAQLKGQLAGKPAAAPAPAPEPAPPAPEPVIAAAPAAAVAAPVAAAPAAAAPEPAPVEDPLAALGLDNLDAPDPVADAAPATTASPTGASVADPLAAADSAAAATPAADLGFDALAGQVEQSLQPAAGAAPAAAAAPPGPEKSDADLVAEFEKMLNG